MKTCHGLMNNHYIQNIQIGYLLYRTKKEKIIEVNKPKLIFFSQTDRKKGTIIEAHVHNCYEIVYFTKADGVLTIGNTEYKLRSNRMYLVYPNTSHKEIHTSDGHVLFFGFNYDKFPSVLSETLYDISEHGVIRKLIEDIIDEATNQKEFYDKIISIKITELIYLIQRYSSYKRTACKNFDYVMNYIRENSNQDIDFTLLAKMTGYSYDHFRHLFKQQFGISPKQFQMNQRMKNACHLLKTSDLSCTEISYKCGFSNSAQFSAMFRKYFGVTPKAFSKKLT